MFLKSLAYCGNVNLQMELFFVWFFGWFFAGNWQYSSIWPHTKDSFPHASVIPYSRSGNIGFMSYLLGEDGNQNVTRHQPTPLYMLGVSLWCIFRVSFLVHSKCGRLIYQWPNYWPSYITFLYCPGSLKSSWLWLWASFWLALAKRIWQKCWHACSKPGTQEALNIPI